jgi:hypothetical protein
MNTGKTERGDIKREETRLILILFRPLSIAQIIQVIQFKDATLKQH